VINPADATSAGTAQNRRFLGEMRAGVRRPAPRPDRARGQKQHHEHTRSVNQTTVGDRRSQSRSANPFVSNLPEKGR
jgi:hypothetical protein